MAGGCRQSPHGGHYWVEDIPDTDKWECRWCGRIRHFNRERIAATEMVGVTAAVNVRASRRSPESVLADKLTAAHERFHLDVGRGGDSSLSSS
jgi:hypothetical protein